MTSPLDHEQLDVYHLELEFIRWVTPLITEVKEVDSPSVREVCDHLDRGSLSALFNTAEGNGKRRMKLRARFFDDARGSATECSACLDALVAKEVCPMERVANGKELLVRIVSMLTKLVQRFSLNSQSTAAGTRLSRTRDEGRGRGRGGRRISTSPDQNDVED